MWRAHNHSLINPRCIGCIMGSGSPSHPFRVEVISPRSNFETTFDYPFWVQQGIFRFKFLGNLFDLPVKGCVSCETSPVFLWNPTAGVRAQRTLDLFLYVTCKDQQYDTILCLWYKCSIATAGILRVRCAVSMFLHVPWSYAEEERQILVEQHRYNADITDVED